MSTVLMKKIENFIVDLVVCRILGNFVEGCRETEKYGESCRTKVGKNFKTALQHNFRSGIICSRKEG